MPGMTTYHAGHASTVNRPEVVWRWTSQPQCVGLARSQLRKALAGWELAGVEDIALVVLSELITNAVVHARVSPADEIETHFVRVGGGVRIEVRDGGSELPVPRVPRSGGGWGLALVDQLAARWGVERRPGPGAGKSVWAVIAAAEGARRDVSDGGDVSCGVG